MLRIEVDFATQREPERVGGCGLIVVNPPWMLAEEAEILMTSCAKVFKGNYRIEWIARGE